jgi:CBS domain-containing protein
MKAAHWIGQGGRVYTGPPFDEARVDDVMRAGVCACDSSTSARDVGRMMSTGKTYSVVVQDVETGYHPWGMVSALEVAAAADSDLDELRAIDIATTGIVTVPANESLSTAAKLMLEHGITDLVVVDRDTGEARGLLSACDLAAVLAASQTSSLDSDHAPAAPGVPNPRRSE